MNQNPAVDLAAKEHTAAGRGQRNATTDVTDVKDQTRRKKLRQERHLSRNSFYMLFISSMLRKLQNTPNSSVVSRVSSMISPPSRGGGGFVETTTKKTSSPVGATYSFPTVQGVRSAWKMPLLTELWNIICPGSAKMAPLTGLERKRRDGLYEEEYSCSC